MEYHFHDEILTSYVTVSRGIPCNIPRATCIFWYTPDPLYQENTRDEWDISQYTTRKGCTTILYHAIQNIGSISAALSCQVYPPRQEPSGEERRLIPRTAADNRAYTKYIGQMGRLGVIQLNCMIDGKVRWNTDEITTAFLHSDWLYFLWLGRKRFTKFIEPTEGTQNHVKVRKCNVT